MISFAAIRETLYDWANENLDMTVIWVNQGEYRPPKPYATLNLRLLSRIGQDELRGGGKLTGVREADLSVNVYGADAMDAMSALQDSLELPSVQESLRRGGVVYVRAPEIQDLTRLLESQFETRSQMDVRIRLANISVTDPVLGAEDGSGWIETVEVEGLNETTIIGG